MLTIFFDLSQKNKQFITISKTTEEYLEELLFRYICIKYVLTIILHSVTGTLVTLCFCRLFKNEWI